MNKCKLTILQCNVPVCLEIMNHNKKYDFPMNLIPFSLVSQIWKWFSLASPGHHRQSCSQVMLIFDFKKQ